MEHVFSAWNSIEKRLDKKYLYLFLDCDGTLAPIADTPAQARIPEKTKEALISLSRLDRFRLAIISGRSLSDIKKVVGLSGIIYVGNHGLEIEGKDIVSDWKPAQSYKKNLAEIKTQLITEFALMPGVFVEDKDLSLCLHYRIANIDEDKIKAILDKVVGPYRASGKISVMYGKKVSEIRPVAGWDKGKIVRWLLDRERLLLPDEDIVAIYAGDDKTDEDAFKALGDSEISIMVGKDSISAAKYYVDDTEQVYKFLKMILGARSY